MEAVIIINVRRVSERIAYLLPVAAQRDDGTAIRKGSRREGEHGTARELLGLRVAVIEQERRSWSGLPAVRGPDRIAGPGM